MPSYTGNGQKMRGKRTSGEMNPNLKYLVQSVDSMYGGAALSVYSQLLNTVEAQSWMQLPSHFDPLYIIYKASDWQGLHVSA